jgi:hypothetical protein
MTDDQVLRKQLVRLLDWHDAHVDFNAAVDGIPPALYGAIPPGLARSPWQIVEHLRIAQHDILDFCVNPSYREMAWPADYWPPDAAPPSRTAWNESLTAYRHDVDALKRLVLDQPDLSARIPHGSGQTYLREVLLVADHTAYHVGQLVLVRRLLGIWAE